MKKIGLILFLFINLTVNAQSVAKLDLDYGYNSMHFEDRIEQFPNLKSFDQTKDSQFVFYRKSDESPTLNGASVDMIYTFFKGQLSTVLIQTKDSMGSRKILELLTRLYGKGVQRDLYIQQYNWYGTKVLLSYNEDMNNFTTRVFISSIKMKLKYEGRSQD